ncbi:MAG: GMP synthase-like glutamine amidotransferase [Saprospiraceae bacterium]|jgi:GMP synthase-like glutamine amidotransferase
MIAGLFVCDHVNIDAQGEFGDYPDMFARLFPDFEWKLYDVYNGHFPENLEECDVYFSTGSSHSVYEDLEWITRLKEVIREIYRLKKYFVGFCFGHQLIGEALGGKVQKSPNGWCIGVHRFEIEKQRLWMQPSKKSINVLMMCQDQILELPENSTVLGGNEMCPVGIIQVGETMLGIQGHPEYPKEYNKFLMINRVDRIGRKLVDEALISLDKEVNRDTMRDWFIRFLNRSV